MSNRLDHYLRLWHLYDPELLAHTPRGDVYSAYHNNQQVVLKLLTADGIADESDAVIALRYFDGQGAVRVLAYDEDAQLLEYAGDEELAERVTRGHDLAAAKIIADVLSQLHRPQPDVPVPELRTLRQVFVSLLSRAERDKTAGNESIYVRGARVTQHLLATPQDECVLHGDLQHHNIRMHPVRGWLAYDPKGFYGERLFDVGNVLCNPSTAREQVLSESRFLNVSALLADELGADLDRLRAWVFAYACLSASWPDKPEGSDFQEWFLTIARIAEKHVATGI